MVYKAPVMRLLQRQRQGGKNGQHGAAYYTKHFPVAGGDKCVEGAFGMIANDLHSPMCFHITLHKKNICL